MPSHIPSLADLLDQVGDSFELSLDLKGGGVNGESIGAVVIATVREAAPALLPRLWLCSPSWEQLVALRSLDETVKLVDSTRLAKIKEGLERRANTLAHHGIDAVNLHHTDWTGGLVALVHRFGRYALGWDLQVERLLHDAFRMGLDGVFSDWVDRMMDAHRAQIGSS